MNLGIGIVGLPNVGPIQNLLRLVVYIHAAEGRLYETALSGLFIKFRGGTKL